MQLPSDALYKIDECIHTAIDAREQPGWSVDRVWQPPYFCSYKLVSPAIHASRLHPC